MINKLSNIINKYIYQIMFTVIISIITLYIFPSLIVNIEVTNSVKSSLLGFCIGLFFAKINNYKNIDGHILLNCYLGYALSFCLIKHFDNLYLNIICFLIIIVCNFYVVNTIINNKDTIKKNKSLILELIALIIAGVALCLQIIDFLN